MKAPIPVLVALGAEMEVAADEYLHAAISDADYADTQRACNAPQAMIDRYANGSTAVYRDAVQAIEGLRQDLSLLPADLAVVLDGLRRMRTWVPSAIRERVLSRRPLVATSLVSYNCTRAIDVINAFLRQAEAEHLLSSLKTVVEHEGVDHPETAQRCRALLAHIDQMPAISAPMRAVA